MASKNSGKEVAFTLTRMEGANDLGTLLLKPKRFNEMK